MRSEADEEFYREMNEEENWKRRRSNARIAWACSGPGGYWFDSAEPYDNEDEEEDE